MAAGSMATEVFFSLVVGGQIGFYTTSYSDLPCVWL